jgi:hypothetical protein
VGVSRVRRRPMLLLIIVKRVSISCSAVRWV